MIVTKTKRNIIISIIIFLLLIILSSCSDKNYIDENTNMDDDQSIIENNDITQPDYIALKLSENSDVNMLDLLPQGKSYFSFTPTYTSNYTFNIDTSESLQVKIADDIYSNGFSSIFYEGETYLIEIYGNINRITAPINISPLTTLTNIPLTSNGQYLCKYAVAENDAGIKIISSTNINIRFLKVLKLEADSLVDYITIYEDTTISIPFKAGTYYILIKNTSTEDIINDVNISGNISELEMDGSVVLSSNKNTNYIKFQSSEPETTRFTFKYNSSIFKNITILSAGLNTIKPDMQLTSYIDLVLESGQIIYIGMNKSSNYETNDFVDFTVTAEKSEYGYTWQIGEENILGNIIEVIRGSLNIEIKLYLNDELLPIDEWYIYYNSVDYPFVTIEIIDNKSYLSISPDSNIGGYGYTVAPIYNGNRYFPTLCIIPIN